MQAIIDTSAQLQQQLAQKGTDLASAERELARLRQELSQAQQAKLEATKVKLVVHLHNDNTLHVANGVTATAYLPSRCMLCWHVFSAFPFSIEGRRLLHVAAR